MSTITREFDSVMSIRLAKFNPNKQTDVFNAMAICDGLIDSVQNRGYATTAAVLLPTYNERFGPGANFDPLIGFNDIPAMCIDEYCHPVRGTQRAPKFVSLGHAELMLIGGASRRGVITENASLALNWFPCLNCAHSMVNAGITTVIGRQPDYHYKPEQYDFKLAEDYLLTSGVRVIKVDTDNRTIDDARHQADT